MKDKTKQQVNGLVNDLLSHDKPKSEILSELYKIIEDQKTVEKKTTVRKEVNLYLGDTDIKSLISDLTRLHVNGYDRIEIEPEVSHGCSSINVYVTKEV